MTSTERIREYHEIPAEAPDDDLKKKPSKQWPEEGAISLANVSFSYFEGGPLALKNINIDIKPKEKVLILRAIVHGCQQNGQRHSCCA